MRRLSLVSALVLVVSLVTPGASAAPPVPQPAGAISGVELVANLPEAAQATSLNFLAYGRGRDRRDVLVANGRFGLITYDIRDPEHPVLLDRLTSEELKLPGDTTGTFWQNEDMDVDQGRKLVFMARDPRAYGGTTGNDASVSGVYVVDARDPEDLRLVTFHAVPTGHTSTCIAGASACDYLWTGGPASNAAKQQEWPGGRPIFVTDVRDPANPVTSLQPIDLFRADGVTAYSHDVQVDAAGIAWVSGAGGIRGYHTRGRHLDPLTGQRRIATAFDPVPYAGGGIAGGDAPSGFMHNSIRPVGRTTADGPRPGPGNRPGSLIMGTEEAFGSPTCDGIGQFVISSLEGSYDGEGWRSTPEEPFRLRTVGTWSPAGEEGTTTGPGAFCSAHYFELRDRVVAYSWYGQGTRFLDVTDPTDPVQVAYYRPDGGVSWAPYFHGDHVFVADHTRGVDILRLTGEARRAQAAHVEVTAPPLSTVAAARLETLAARFAPDPQLGWACVIPRA